MNFRRCAVLLVALVLASCSHGKARGTKDAAPTGSEKSEPAPAAIVIPVQALHTRSSGKFASRRELEWAGAWVKWQERVEVRLDDAAEILGDAERRANATPGSRDGKRLAAALGLLRSCSEDAVARGAPPSTRLEPVALETAEVCKRLEKAVALADAAGLEKDFSPDAAFAADHLETATREVRSFVPGLDEEIDPLPFSDRPSRKSRIQIRYTYAATVSSASR